MKKIYGLILLCLLSLSSCIDERALIDISQPISGRNWSYIKKVRIEFEIIDPKPAYNIYVNLRHTDRYKYSNIFMLIHTTSPDRKTVTERREFRLAMPDGEWLGSGSGNLYTCQMPLKMNYRFPAAGKYVIELEQNMRDNPLQHISDVGMRIEKAAE